MNILSFSLIDWEFPSNAFFDFQIEMIRSGFLFRCRWHTDSIFSCVLWTFFPFFFLQLELIGLLKANIFKNEEHIDQLVGSIAFASKQWSSAWDDIYHLHFSFLTSDFFRGFPPLFWRTLLTRTAFFFLHRRAFFPTYIQLYTGCMQLNKYWKLDWVISRVISILGFWILQHSHALHEQARLAEKFLKLAQAHCRAHGSFSHVFFFFSGKKLLLVAMDKLSQSLLSLVGVIANWRSVGASWWGHQIEVRLLRSSSACCGWACACVASMFKYSKPLSIAMWIHFSVRCNNN